MGEKASQMMALVEVKAEEEEQGLGGPNEEVEEEAKKEVKGGCRGHTFMDLTLTLTLTLIGAVEAIYLWFMD